MFFVFGTHIATRNDHRYGFWQGISGETYSQILTTRMYDYDFGVVDIRSVLGVAICRCILHDGIVIAVGSSVGGLRQGSIFVARSLGHAIASVFGL